MRLEIPCVKKLAVPIVLKTAVKEIAKPNTRSGSAFREWMAGMNPNLDRGFSRGWHRRIVRNRLLPGLVVYLIYFWCSKIVCGWAEFVDLSVFFFGKYHIR
jgi:hypothetical protein